MKFLKNIIIIGHQSILPHFEAKSSFVMARLNYQLIFNHNYFIHDLSIGLTIDRLFVIFYRLNKMLSEPKN